MVGPELLRRLSLLRRVRGWAWRGWGRASLAARLSSGRDPVLHRLFEAVGVGLAVLDEHGALAAWNTALTGIAGPTLPLRRGMPALALVAAEARDRVAASLAAGRTAEAPLASAEGTRVEFTPIRLDRPEQGTLLRVVQTGPGAPVEATLAASARLQAVGALAGGIAHDFNNLLTAIAVSAEAALDRGQDSGSAMDLHQILDSAARGAALVRQLLAFARQQALQPRVVELNAAIEEVGGLLRRLLGQRVRLELDLEEPGRRVKIDPTQLDQVIINLALNARDAMPEGGRLRIATGHAVVLRSETIGTDTLPPGRYALLEVTDSGVGIPPEVLPRIFEPFYTTRREQGGTGLGLATVHGIVRQSGGFIAVESVRGRGTTFRIWLPRHEAPASQPAEGVRSPSLHRPGPDRPRRTPAAPEVAEPAQETVPAPVPPPPQPAAAPASCTLLLVEDEPPLLRLAERALTRAGFTVATASSAEDALALVEGEKLRPGALISDVVMPGLDGFALVDRLRASQPGLPALLVSGYSEAALGRDLAEDGLKLLPKPYRLDELVAAAQSVLPLARAEVS